MIWIVTGESESGDEFGPEIFKDEPTEKDLSKWAHNCDGHFNDKNIMEDWEEGPGYDGSYVHVTVTPKDT